MYYRQNKEKRLADNKIWRQLNPEKRAEQSWAENKKSKYGLSKDDVIKMYKAQNEQCAICSISKPIKGRYGLYVDHNHKTGKVRALLCMKCNGGLGQFNDKPELLQKASEYLIEHGVN